VIDIYNNRKKLRKKTKKGKKMQNLIDPTFVKEG